MSVRLQVVMAIPGKEPREFDYEFDQDEITLGREEDNDIQIPLSTVSRNHAVIRREGDEWFIEDLRSTHGTKHNGRVIGAGGKKLLRDGDTVEIVHFTITFQRQETFSDDYSVEHTEALARKMVEEVLASIGKEELPYVRVMNGPDEGRRFELTPEMSEVVVGRGNDCDFQINDANISRRHAVIRRDWNDITIDDMGSKNGVLINDRKIAKATSLRDADEILLGAVRLTFIDPSAKFIGKLDDIPAFANEDEEEYEDEEEDFSDEQPAPPVDESAYAVPEPEPAPPPKPAPKPEPAALEEDGAAEAPTSMLDKKGFGVFEYVLIGGVVVVALGFIVGVILLVT